jgi:hypothetical protein
MSTDDLTTATDDAVVELVDEGRYVEPLGGWAERTEDSD